MSKASSDKNSKPEDPTGKIIFLDEEAALASTTNAMFNTLMLKNVSYIVSLVLPLLKQNVLVCRKH